MVLHSVCLQLVEAEVAADAMTPSRHTLEQLARDHPVLSIILSRSEAINSITLHEFVEYELKNGNQRVPYTFTEFFTDYLNFLIVRHLRYNRAQYAPRHFRWNIPESMARLAKIAFLNYVCEVPITYKLLEKILPGDKELFGDAAKPGGEFKPDMIFRTFGLLEIVSAEHKRILYHFKEPCIQEYLVAHFQAIEALRKVTKGKHKVVTTGMRDCMRKLPFSGDVWRMTFGLLNMRADTCQIQKDVLSVLIEEAKRLPLVRPFDITALCVEATYESQNAGELTELLDDFTLNQTLNYSNVYISTTRLPYAISAVGYLVRASPNVYGVHMSNFAINENNIAMLADPVNEVSDNNLQVLNLSNNKLGTKGVKRLQRFIVKATLLTHLDLTACDMGNLGAALLSEFFMCVPLRYLRLTNNGIGDPALKHMSSNLKYVPTLEWLDISENSITDKSAKHLAEALPSLPNLRSLDLRKNEISDDGCEAVTRELSNLNKVTQLMLSENKIGETGANRIANHVWKTRSLRFINLSLNNIPETGILGLRRAANSHGSLKIEVSPNGKCNGNMVILPEDGVSEPGTSLGEGEPDLSKSVDLLAGRFDSLPTRRRLEKRPSWPGDEMRRSWHGMTGSLRHSFKKIEYQ